jgi:hypothetical protein
MPHIGSTGIGFIVGLFTSTTVNAGQFVMVGLQPRVSEIFRLTRLNTIIPSAPDVASGFAFAASPREPAHREPKFERKRSLRESVISLR